MRRGAKMVLRHAVDRVVRPYVDEHAAQLAELRADLAAVERGAGLPAEVVTPAVAPWPVELTDFNLLLHSLRSVELGRMPVASQVLLSVGCSDRSYFDWIERAHGHVPEHWGVEFYRPEPAELPTNARWIVGSASSMPAVADASVDVVFSGQNIEHLPASDLVGFLTESRRVLRPGGHLVVDSPNRLMTAALGWRHPEHVVELSPDEAIELLSLAGFDTASCRGSWLCAESDGGVLPLMPEPGDVDELLRRALHGVDAPARSFCWWIEAVATDRRVDRERLGTYVADLVAALWPERVNRGANAAGAGAPGVSVAPGEAGLIYRAGPLPLFTGWARVDVEGTGVDRLTVRVLDEHFTVLAEGSGTVSLDVPATRFGVWVDVVGTGVSREPAVVTGVRVDAPWLAV